MFEDERDDEFFLCLDWMILVDIKLVAFVL
jgi:hypothetical protein